MLLLDGQTADNQAKMYRLWVHEVYRVFYDRLVDSNDRKAFFTFIKVHLLPLAVIKSDNIHRIVIISSEFRI